MKFNGKEIFEKWTDKQSFTKSSFFLFDVKYVRKKYECKKGEIVIIRMVNN